MIDPLLIVFDVASAPGRSFELWTARTSAWWPASHTVSGRSDLEVILEPRVGGRILERTPSGEEHEWGRITAWEPPRRIAYLWYLRQDRADATEVEITFSEADGAGTTISIEHRGWERLGSRGPQRREQNESGWAGLLRSYRAAAGRPRRTGVRK